MEAVKHGSKRSATVMKVMGVFSGVQVVTILCAVVRTKLVAIFIGAAGVGLFGIFNTAMEMLSAITTLGIGSSSVRDMAAAPESELPLTARVVKRWGWILGLFGALAMILLAPVLSAYSFRDGSATWQFMLLAICMLFHAATSCNLAVMQGFRRFRNLAMSSVWGAVGGVAVSAPLFYFLGIDSIIPALIGFALVSYAASRINSPKLPPVRVTRRDMDEKGRSFLKLGAYMTVSAFTGYLVNYLFLSWLNNRAGVDEVGYYQGGYTLISRYTSLIFSAIAVEYYPRLSTVAQRRRATMAYVNNEAALLTWMLLAIVPAFILMAPVIIRLLYSSDFMAMLPMITIGITGTVMRGLSWCISYTVLAKGDGRLFLFTEVVSSLTLLALNMLGWRIGGLTGLGCSFVVFYAMYLAMMWLIYRRYYHMSIARGVVWQFVAVAAVSGLSAAVSLMPGWWWTVNIAITAAAAAVALRNLRRLYAR